MFELHDVSLKRHPQFNGQTKHMNRVWEDNLRLFVSPSQENWDEHLPWTELALNNAFNKSIQDMPFKLVYGIL